MFSLLAGDMPCMPFYRVSFLVILRRIPSAVLWFILLLLFVPLFKRGGIDSGWRYAPRFTGAPTGVFGLLLCNGRVSSTAAPSPAFAFGVVKCISRLLCFLVRSFRLLPVGTFCRVVVLPSAATFLKRLRVTATTYNMVLVSASPPSSRALPGWRRHSFWDVHYHSGFCRAPSAPAPSPWTVLRGSSVPTA